MKLKVKKICILTMLVGLFLTGCQENPSYTDLTPSLKDEMVIAPEIEKEEVGTISDSLIDSSANDHLSETVPSMTPNANQGSVSSIASSSATVHFIDSGNSDSVLIESNGKFAVIDAGDLDDDQLMVEYLSRQGVKTIDYLIISHFHADHFGGADSIVKTFEVKQTLVNNGSAETKVYRDFIQALADKGLKPSVPLEGVKMPLGDGVLTFYNTKGGEKDENDNSLVVLFENGNDRFLFTGDANQKIERTLTMIPTVDVLKLGHHGSSTSSNEAFIRQIHPSYAVAMVGEGNSYGHPHIETMQLLQKLEIPLYRTDEQGTIIFKSTGHGVTVNQSTPGSYLSGREKEGQSLESPNQISQSTEPNTQNDTVSSTEYYKNCTLLREVYPDGVPSDHPAYRSGLDRDRDNWACER